MTVHLVHFSFQPHIRFHFCATLGMQWIELDVTVSKGLPMGTNAGNKVSMEHGDVFHYESKVWKDEAGIADGFSCAELVDQCPMTCDNSKEDEFTAHDEDDEGMKFQRNCTSNPHNFNSMGTKMMHKCSSLR